ncbi:Thioredoxin [Chryseobacterium piscicola]|uniref:Thioredoxin n=1 Tax=Chryseobacterium piscicola TaxID=551459 RepID=A0A1N7KSL5_9FLAO|nr:vitamin K epoxide reductase family protein [Chryseobacterium piscicola]PQA94985.1 hypothetical protein B0A70_06600 [Chryseobacterium piscicola]SIS64486.1 Thioredoxin [Chryseobacterium piscicola]
MDFEKLTQHLNIDSKEFNFQFQTHPDYPSALAFSSALNFLGIKNNAYDLKKEYWQELPEEFITIHKNKFSLIKKDKNRYIVHSDEMQSISEKELLVNSQNMVMLFEKKEISIFPSKKTINYTVFFLILLSLYLSYSFLQKDWASFIFNIVSVFGIYISFEIFSQKFGNESVALNRICGNTSKNVNSSCIKVMNSDQINIFGLKLSDFSLIYFVGLSIVGLLLPYASTLLQIATLFSVVVIFYSLYVQIFVEKAICKICLIIILLLIFQLILSRFFIAVPISSFIILASIFIVASVFIGIIYINDLLTKNDSLEKSNLKNLKFKRNYHIFMRELILQNKILFKNNKDGFFLGNPNAKVHISIVSNPYCGFCKEAHEMLQKLLTNYPNDISVQIRFNYSKNISENSQDLTKTLYSIYSKKGKEDFLKTLHFWFENRDEKQFFKKYNNDDSMNMQEIISSSLENKENGLNFTPNIILNGYQFPDKYDREDIFYFIDELLEDEDFLNEN